MADRNITLKGFTLSAFNIREADRLLRLLTKERGLISAYAGGAAKPKSRLVACSMPFTLSEFVLYAHNDRYSVKSADIIYAFHGIHSDFDRLSEASRLAVLFEDASRFDSGQTDLYELLGYALFAIADRPDPALCAALAALRLMVAIGFAPYLSDCVVCHKETVSPFVFSFARGGILCRLHRPNTADLIRISESMLRGLRRAMELPLDRVFSLYVSATDRNTMLEWIWRYLEFTMEKPYPGFAVPDAYKIKAKEEKQS